MLKLACTPIWTKSLEELLADRRRGAYLHMGIRTRIPIACSREEMSTDWHLFWRYGMGHQTAESKGKYVNEATISKQLSQAWGKEALFVEAVRLGLKHVIRILRSGCNSTRGALRNFRHTCTFALSWI